MNEPRTEIHSFVVKLWVEAENGTTRWHGYITHVPSEGRSYVTTLRDIPRFIAPYLKEAGVGTPCWWGIGRGRG